MRIIYVIAALALAIALNLLAWYWPNRPVLVGQGLDQPMQSVSFAPFRRGQSPLTHTYPSAAQIEDDIKALVGKTRALRTYTTLHGMDLVPRLAGKYGMKVMHGAWLSSEIDRNAQEINALIEAANRHPDIIDRVIVGNEVLLRNDMKAPQLENYIRQVKRAIKQPVTYADVWEFWLANPELADSVDFITIHILPYWENEPIGIGRVERHIQDIYKLVQRRFPGKPILIGETGWPSAGRMRNDARPGLLDQARYTEIFLRVAGRENWAYNYIEAFDQVWKAHQEGIVGAHWGLLDDARVAKFTLGKPIVEDQGWFMKAILASVLATMATLAFAQRRREVGFGGALLFALFAQASFSVLVLASAENWQNIYNFGRAMGTAVFFVLALVMVLYLLRGWAEAIAGHAIVPDRIRRIRGSLQAVRDDGVAAVFRHPALAVQLLHLLYAVLAIWFCAALIFDGRYRDFPVYDFLAPALLMTLFKLGTALHRSHRGRGHRLSEAMSVGRPFGWIGEPAASMKPDFTRLGPVLPELLVSAGLIAGAAGIIYVEGWLNHQALAWAALALLLAWPYLATIRLSWAQALAEQPPESFTGKW